MSVVGGKICIHNSIMPVSLIPSKIITQIWVTAITQIWVTVFDFKKQTPRLKWRLFES
jgi:hypothetical protein